MIVTVRMNYNVASLCTWEPQPAVVVTDLNQATCCKYGGFERRDNIRTKARKNKACKRNYAYGGEQMSVMRVKTWDPNAQGHAL